MNRIYKVYFLFSFILCQMMPAMSMSVDMNLLDQNIPKGQQFKRKEAKVYLECTDAKTVPHENASKRSFSIKTCENKEKVGFICAIYFPKKERIEISLMEVVENERRKGYGEEAVRTVLGIYRSEKNQPLKFKRFYLQVERTWSEREAARKLYKKVGFKEVKDINVPDDYMALELDRLL